MGRRAASPRRTDHGLVATETKIAVVLAEVASLVPGGVKLAEHAAQWSGLSVDRVLGDAVGAATDGKSEALVIWTLWT